MHPKYQLFFCSFIILNAIAKSEEKLFAILTTLLGTIEKSPIIDSTIIILHIGCTNNIFVHFKASHILNFNLGEFMNYQYVNMIFGRQKRVHFLQKHQTIFINSKLYKNLNL